MVQHCSFCDVRVDAKCGYFCTGPQRIANSLVAGGTSRRCDQNKRRNRLHDVHPPETENSPQDRAGLNRAGYHRHRSSRQDILSRRRYRQQHDDKSTRQFITSYVPLHLISHEYKRIMILCSTANKIQQGGLSGSPLKPLSLKALKTLRTHLPSEIPLIGCGGISSGSDALDYAKSGATFVQVYTGFGYDGAGACRRIKDELTDLLKAEGTSWMGVVKRATEELSFKQEEDKGDVGTLIKEAEELKRLLDTFGERIGQMDSVAATS